MIAAPANPTTSRDQVRPTRTLSGKFIWFFGVILPLAAIAFEAATAICINLVDPMPTPWHLLLLIAVPVCNALAWRGLQRDAWDHSRLLAGLAGFSGAIALVYTILFAPIMPLALIGLLVLLPGLAFAPVLALWTSVRLIRAWAGFAGARAIVLGAACGLAALVLPTLPVIGVHAGAGMVDSERSWVRETGFDILRLDPIRQALAEACDPPSTAGAHQWIGLISWSGPLSPEEARRLYYRATGKAFDVERVSHWRRTGWLSFDTDRGGNRAGRPTNAVQLSASRIDGTVDARSAVAYLEWTLVFHNTSGVQQEARTELALPPGSVVSRVTLWVHGDEREAAFGERGQVRQAYESVVRARRDPLLVSSSGRDRVLVQCFPIEPAGDMKIRVGVTAPVVPEGLSDHGIVVLPALMARNFDAAEAASVWVESTAGLTPAAGKFATRVREDGMHVAQGEYRADERAAIRVSGLNWGSTWTPDKSTGTGGVVEQRFVERPIAPPERAIVIVDGSESMRPMQNEIGAALAAIPPQMEKRVIVATHAGVANWLPAMPWRGGVDPLPALQEALRAANDTRRTTILWIAGEQPLKLSGAETIRQVLEREAGRVTLLVLPGGGENVPLRDLDGVAGVETVPRLGSVAEDLGRLFERWRDGQFERVAARQVQHRSAIPDGAQRGSSHVVRLWAADEVARIVSIKRRDAVALAVGHKIVTPVSGAVVLETAAQYTENSLQQPSGSTPAITPEPGTWALFAIGCAALGVLSRRRRSAAHSPLV